MFYAGASRRGGARAQHADAFVKPHASSQFTLANRHSFFLKDSPNLAAVDQHRNPQLVDNLLPALVFVFGTQVAMMLTGLTSGSLCVLLCRPRQSPPAGLFLTHLQVLVSPRRSASGVADSAMCILEFSFARLGRRLARESILFSSRLL